MIGFGEKYVATILVLIGTSQIASFSQLIHEVNQCDQEGYRHGMWEEFVDENLDDVTSEKDAFFVRRIQYSHGHRLDPFYTGKRYGKETGKWVTNDSTRLCNLISESGIPFLHGAYTYISSTGDTLGLAKWDCGFIVDTTIVWNEKKRYVDQIIISRQAALTDSFPSFYIWADQIGNGRFEAIEKQSMKNGRWTLSNHRLPQAPIYADTLWIWSMQSGVTDLVINDSLWVVLGTRQYCALPLNSKEIQIKSKSYGIQKVIDLDKTRHLFLTRNEFGFSLVERSLNQFETLRKLGKIKEKRMRLHDFQDTSLEIDKRRRHRR